MTTYSPPYFKNRLVPGYGREELFNVTIDTAYIYGIYREDDNDFHMIIGNGKTGAGMHLLKCREYPAFRRHQRRFADRRPQ